jgi:hypothetical protein
MVVSEAAERLRGRRPKFADNADIEAVALLGLYSDACRVVRRRMKLRPSIERKLTELWGAGLETFADYIDPPRNRRKGERRVH